jgi:hypothetical protein
MTRLVRLGSAVAVIAPDVVLFGRLGSPGPASPTPESITPRPLVTHTEGFRPGSTQKSRKPRSQRSVAVGPFLDQAVPPARMSLAC